ncbi:MAG: lysylphosphatidylglycerol synthase transmembrane domain-containing protein [Gammaproteobacteria bacterium]
MLGPTFFLRLGGSLLLLGIAFVVLKGDAIWGALAELTAGGILAAAMAVVLAISLGAARWGVLLAALGHRPGAGPVAAASFVGNALNVLLPTGMAGDLVKALVVGGRERISLSELLGTVAVDRLLGLTGFACLAVAVLLPMRLSDSDGIGLAASPSFLGLLFLAISVFGALAVVALDRRFPPRRALWRHTLAALATAMRTVYAYRHYRWALAWGLLVSLFAVFFVCIAVWLLALPFAVISPVSVVLAVTGGSLIALLPISINGLGSREMVFVFVLGKAGLTADEAVALSLAWFAITTVISVALGGLALGTAPHLVSLTRLRALVSTVNSARREH